MTTPRCTTSLDEAGWVLRAQRGEPLALTYLFEAYFERVYRYVSARVRDPAAAEDVTQEVFERMLLSIHRYQPRGLPFSSWLFRIAHNLVVDQARRADSSERATLRAAQPDVEDGPELETLARLEIDELHTLMRRLPEAQRQVLELRFAAQLNIAETARVMERSIDAVKSLQYAALKALRSMVAAEDHLAPVERGVVPG
jgi:RNA polymerase sigma-70 factor (ECF subfamily)